MALDNQWSLIGNVGRDPEYRVGKYGGIATISLATTDHFKDRETGEFKDHTEWHRVTFYGRLADTVRDHVKQGRQLALAGTLRTRKWSDAAGKTQYTLELRCEELKFLGSSSGNRSQSQPSAPARQTPQQDPGGFPGASDSFPMGSPMDFEGGDSVPF